MSRKKKELPLLESITITDVAAEGKALARHDQMVIFIPYGAPGDVADIKIDKKKRSYAEGHIARMISPSASRVLPRCVHFGTCGGCKWQHLPYSIQLEAKQRQVKDALDRIAKIGYPDIRPIIGSDETYCYRNKMEYAFSNRSWLTFEQLKSGEAFPDRNAAGFHISGAFDKVLDITSCQLQDSFGDRLRHFVKNYCIEHGLSFYDIKNNVGFIRTMMIRIASTGETMCVISFGEDSPDEIENLLRATRTEFPELTSLQYVINLKGNDSFGDLEIIPHSGKEYIEEEMEGLRFRIGPKSFYQTNSKQAYKLYTVARDFAELTGNELVYDLYTGTGTIANFVSRNAKKVIGIEYVPEAIEDAKVNSRVNGIENTRFFAGDMKDILTDDFIATNGKPDVMIVDPPRAGMHEDVINVILNAEPSRIVYVSCNPATQARDLQLLNRKYSVDAVQPVDMFPHTQHVENVVKLTKRTIDFAE